MNEAQLKILHRSLCVWEVGIRKGEKSLRVVEWQVIAVVAVFFYKYPLSFINCCYCLFSSHDNSGHKMAATISPKNNPSSNVTGEVNGKKQLAVAMRSC